MNCGCCFKYGEAFYLDCMHVICSECINFIRSEYDNKCPLCDSIFYNIKRINLESNSQILKLPESISKNKVSENDNPIILEQSEPEDYISESSSSHSNEDTWRSKNYNNDQQRFLNKIIEDVTPEPIRHPEPLRNPEPIRHPEPNRNPEPIRHPDPIDNSRKFYNLAKPSIFSIKVVVIFLLLFSPFVRDI